MHAPSPRPLQGREGKRVTVWSNGRALSSTQISVQGLWFPGPRAAPSPPLPNPGKRQGSRLALALVGMGEQGRTRERAEPPPQCLGRWTTYGRARGNWTLAGSSLSTDGSSAVAARGYAELGQESQAMCFLRNGTPFASRVVHGVSGPLSNCVWNLQVFPDDARWCH